DTRPQLTHWQHDPRRALRCMHFKPDWMSLVEAYRESYDIAKNDPERYARMGEAAVNRLKRHCSLEASKTAFAEFYHQHIEKLKPSAAERSSDMRQQG
ncbi:MAG: glycosyltransferase family 1 protein, partial [Pseudomonadota bacterium]